jgi:holo-[acyl-carrier protein] synthase
VIYGIGTDLIRISRLQRTLQRHGERFARRILDPVEFAAYSEASDPARYLAKRFAAKEAAAKALGTGIRDGLRLAHLVVTAGPLGQPRLELRGRARDLARERGIVASQLSLSDEGDYALAFVVLETAALPEGRY